MSTSLSFQLVFLLFDWQVEALPILRLQVKMEQILILFTDISIALLQNREGWEGSPKTVG
jgi:hypothetical protein